MVSRVVGLVGFVLIVAAAGVKADTYYVGDQLGWRVPPLGDIAYKTWAAEKSFNFGDTAVFNWTGTHTVAEVSKTDYDNCTSTSPIGTIQTVSPFNVTLNTNSSRYFICTISNHCHLGQKVTLGIGSASSLAIHGLSLALSALAFAFLNHS
ncbi:stellacyanin-like [Rhodamnia argentea]|uniref:Stellacyanin-like n=1 Tax=Rhodamnia argentea TaxID=178133 RepID=A0A8B8QJD3_9MYRT|nr:stellacyanin-like [Rhodamnia argentea]